MIIDIFLDGLKKPTPKARIDMLRVVAMLEETQLLATLREMVKTETDAEVINTLKWAGNLIWRAQQAGYSTAAGMAQHFTVEAPPSETNAREEELLARLQYQFDMDQIKSQERLQRQRMGQKLAMGVVASALAGPALSAHVFLSATNPGQKAESTVTSSAAANLHTVTPQRPTSLDIGGWVRHLHEDDAAGRQKAMVELRGLNNPAAIPHLGYYFATDAEPAVRTEAQRCGKALYFNWVYWEQEDAKKTATAQQSQSEIAQILAKAEAARQQRKKK